MDFFKFNSFMQCVCLLKALFIGWQIPDSFRFTEVLEAGCIPIICRNQEDVNPSWGDTVDYFENFFRLSGINLSDDFIKAPSIVIDLLKDPKALDERFNRVQDWYNQYKGSLRKKVENVFQEYCS